MTLNRVLRAGGIIASQPATSRSWYVRLQTASTVAGPSNENDYDRVGGRTGRERLPGVMDAAERLWDCWERFKSLDNPGNKKQSIESLLLSGGSRSGASLDARPHSNKLAQELQCQHVGELGRHRIADHLR
jgi:hypothetical protein